MKRSAIFVLLLLAGLSLSAQMKPLPEKLREEAVLFKQNKVSTVDIRITIGDGVEALPSLIRYIDKEGRVTTEQVWDHEIGSNTLKTYEYNDDGWLTEVREVDMDSSTVLSVELYYYEDGRLSMSEFSGWDYGYAIYYVYDEKGRVDSTLIGDAEMRRQAWFYNSKGQVDSIVGFTVYSFEEPYVWEKVETQSFKYGKKGVLVQDSFCSQYGGCYIHNFKYKKGLAVLETVSGRDAEIYRITTSYNKQLPVRKEYDVNEEITFQEDEVQTFEYTYY